MAAILDFGTTHTRTDDEVINVPDANPVGLDHDIFYNKTAKWCSIYTGAGFTGTHLVGGTDFDLGGIFPDGSLPESISPDVAYTTISVTNATYQNVDLYVNYYPISDIISAARWNAQQPQLCKAWVNFNGTGTVAIRDSYNVSSITDNGTGDYTINFTNAMSDADYSAGGLAGGALFIDINTSESVLATSLDIRIFNIVAAQSDSPYVMVQIFGS